MKTWIFYVLTLLGVLWGQMALNYFIGSSGLAADAVLVVVLYFGLSRGPLTGQMLGFVWGLLIDASGLGLMGLHPLLYAGAGFLAGMLRRQLDEKKIWTQSIFTVGISGLYVVLYFILDRFFSIGAHPIPWFMLGRPFVNALLAPFFFWLVQRWSELWDMAPQEE